MGSFGENLSGFDVLPFLRILSKWFFNKKRQEMPLNP